VIPDSVATSRGFETLFEITNRELHDRDGSFPIIDDPLGNVELRPEFLGAGYAETTRECKEATRLIQEAEGIRLETTYTGKALAALVHDARSGALGNHSVIFWNTYNSRPYPPNLDANSLGPVPAEFQKYIDN
jgi:D-cysteine desulfhydrase